MALLGIVEVVQSLIGQVVVAKYVRVKLFLVTVGERFPGRLARVARVQIASLRDADASLVRVVGRRRHWTFVV